MASYRTTGSDIFDLVVQVMNDHHKDLVEAGVTVQTLTAHAKRGKDGQPRTAALKLHGYPCAATIQITSLKNRVAGLADARICLDGDTWPERPEEEQVAIIDHELTHLELVCDKDGNLELDDCNRPKLRMRLHDLQLGGFQEVCDRHKMNAIESQTYLDINKTLTQLCFPWG